MAIYPSHTDVVHRLDAAVPAMDPGQAIQTRSWLVAKLSTATTRQMNEEPENYRKVLDRQLRDPSHLIEQKLLEIVTAYRVS